MASRSSAGSSRRAAPAKGKRAGQRSNASKLPAVLFLLLQTDAAANGGLSSISQIIAALKRHRPIIVTDRESPRVAQWRKDGVETHVIPSTRSSLWRNPLAHLSAYWRYTRELRRLIRKTGARVIHANNPLALQLGLPAARSTGAKILLNLRDTIDPGRRTFKPRYALRFGAADHVLFLSNDMADRWADIASNAKRSCTVTYSIVDPKIFLPFPPNSKSPQVVLLSGIVRPKKGQLDFIRHVSPVLAAHGVETWIAGDFDPARDAYMRDCGDAAEPLGDKVKFLGFRDDLPTLFERCTVVAIASRHEGLVRAMIEGMSCARPVVSFDVCSAREILEEKSGGAGVVVRMGDFDGMAKAILTYCRDPEAAARAGEKGRQTASRLFARDEVVARYEHVYQALETQG
jgi:glycosyltransferase involved in cell wall biosynthesis